MGVVSVWRAGCTEVKVTVLSMEDQGRCPVTKDRDAVVRKGEPSSRGGGWQDLILLEESAACFLPTPHRAQGPGRASWATFDTASGRRLPLNLTPKPFQPAQLCSYLSYRLGSMADIFNIIR